MLLLLLRPELLCRTVGWWWWWWWTPLLPPLCPCTWQCCYSSALLLVLPLELVFLRKKKDVKFS